MVIVKTHDKRFHNGFNIHFFETDIITEEVINFVKKNPKAYQVEANGGREYYFSREEFLKAYT